MTVTNITEDDEIVIITRMGKTFKTKVANIRVQNRNTMGSRLLKLNEDDSLSDISKQMIDDEEIETKTDLIDEE